jgi:methylated-DNA-[protein]-cysteine S-methyltransferase
MSRAGMSQEVSGSERVETPVGILEVAWAGECLLRLDLLYAPDTPDEERLTASPLPAAIRAALARYFRDGRAGLDLPLALAGTPFQHRVWQALRAIPPGSTRTYGELARELGTSARAIGGACRANPCLIAVPCHRVVARDGLGGFAGERGGKRLAVKRWLLRHEGAAAGRLP